MSDPSSRRRTTQPPKSILAPSPLLLVGAVILGVSIDRIERIRALPGPWNLVTGPAAFVGGTALFLGALRELRDANTTPSHGDGPPELVTNGVYGYSRNPIYLGNTLQAVGLSLWYNSVWPLATTASVFLYLHQVVFREENYLEARFDDRFRKYRDAVPRWI